MVLPLRSIHNFTDTLHWTFPASNPTASRNFLLRRDHFVAVFIRKGAKLDCQCAGVDRRKIIEHAALQFRSEVGCGPGRAWFESASCPKIPCTVFSYSLASLTSVAKLAGVSTATVSNVMNNTGTVSEATRQRVRAAMQRTKWTTNIDARNLARTTPKKTRSEQIEECV
jgi:hypothetical protein